MLVMDAVTNANSEGKSSENGEVGEVREIFRFHSSHFFLLPLTHVVSLNHLIVKTEKTNVTLFCLHPFHLVLRLMWIL